MFRALKYSVSGIVLCGVLWGIVGSTSAVEQDSIISTYQQAIATDPKDVIAHFNLGLAYYNLDRFDDALEILEKCRYVNRGDKESHGQVDSPANQVLGMIYYSHVQNDGKAIEALKRSLKGLPDDPTTFYAMGLAYLRMKRYHDAVKHFGLAIEKGRDRDPEVHYHIGRAWQAMSKEKEAIASYEQALVLRDDYQPVLESLAFLYHKQKDDKHAVAVLKKLVKHDPMNFNANYLLGLNYYKQKKYSEMVAAYNRAVAVKPDLADAHYNLGMAYFYQTRYDMAIESLKKAVTLNPKDVEGLNLLGQAQSAAVDQYLQQGGMYIAKEQYNQAIAVFQKVLQIDRTHHKAKALLEDTERRLKEELSAHLNLAEKFYQDGRLEDAYNEYELMLQLDSGNRLAQAGIQRTRVQISSLLKLKMKNGRRAEAIGDYTAAREHYEATLILKKNYTAAKDALVFMKGKLRKNMRRFNQLAGSAMAKHDYKAAKRYFEQMKAQAPVFDEVDWLEKAHAGLNRVNDRRAKQIRNDLRLGIKAFQTKARGEAKKYFNRVLKRDPQNKTANDYIRKMTGSVSEAKVNAEKVKEMYYQGVDLYVKGKIAEAIIAWKKVRELDPDNDDARINIERAQSKLRAIKKLTEGR
ncbi:tetratricopeptide repeat protein [bacterium]|nr:tetratricopeptide repeat protein [bacterium]